MSPLITKELIFNYFEGNVSAIQRETIAQWLKNKKNEEQLYRWLEEYENLHPQYDPNLEGAVRNYYRFIAQTDSTSKKSDARLKSKWPQKKRSLWWAWGVAVGLFFVLGLFVYLNSDRWQYKAYHADVGEQKNFILPDGSQVSLLSNSTLKIPRSGFGTRSRDVYLSGAAYFNVKHTHDHKRFIVKTTKRFEVEVLGTEFNVVARETGSRVILKKGKIQLSYQTADDDPIDEPQKLDLKPGDVFTLDRKNQPSLSTTTLPEIQEAWKGNLYLFDQTPLSEVMEQLQDAYGVKTVFTDQELAGHTLTGKYKAENIDELLDLLQSILDIKITRRGDIITITTTEKIDL